MHNKPTVIVQNEGVKYSVLMEKFLENFIKEFEDTEYFEDIFDFAVNAWNFANMKQILPEGESDAAINSIESDEIDFDLLNRMIDYKISNFKEYTNFIVDYELKETDGDPILNVTTQAQEQYLANMFDTMTEETDENDFDEGFINRTAIIIKHQQPFIDWRNNLYPEDIHKPIETNTYLINEDIEDIETWVKKKCEKIFIAELVGWNTNKKAWPQKRNYKMFKEWFIVDISTMIYDFELKPISKI